MTVIPAKGVAGVSDRTQSARETVMAYSPLRALQGEWVLHAAFGMPRSTLPKDDIYSSAALKTDIPAKGVAGVSCSVLHAHGTAVACKPVRALQGGIQRLSLQTKRIKIKNRKP